jgi:hypothetical protein
MAPRHYRSSERLWVGHVRFEATPYVSKLILPLPHGFHETDLVTESEVICYLSTGTEGSQISTCLLSTSKSCCALKIRSSSSGPDIFTTPRPRE